MRIVTSGDSDSESVDERYSNFRRGGRPTVRRAGCVFDATV